jgi:DNA mismatch endonuclease (patch repair protein)
MTENRRNAPRYDDYAPASPVASKAKRRNHPKDTRAEVLLRRALWRRGLRYRLHARDLPGKPDIVFRRERIAIFVDGDFWHGRGWAERTKKLREGANADYWVAKIGYNIERDNKNTALLESMGWTVIRLWETDILKASESAVSEIAGQLALSGKSSGCRSGPP